MPSKWNFVHDRGAFIPLQSQSGLRVSGDFVPKQAFSGYCWRSTELFVERNHGRPEKGAVSLHTTHWTIVMRAVQGQARGGQSALTELCRFYWYPLYVFARLSGHSPDDARDLIRGF